MAAVDDVDEVLEQYHLAAVEFIKGNPEPYKMIFSQGQGGRKRGHHPDRPADDDDPQARGWNLEGGASARRPDNHPSASRVGDRPIALPLERTSQKNKGSERQCGSS